MSVLATRFTSLVGIEHPIVQEGMGPFKTAKLAAAVSEAGGLGTVSMPGMTADPAEGARVLRDHIEETASATGKPFAVNVPVGRASGGEILPISEAYIRAVCDARRADAGLERQLRVLTTSAGFPGEFRPLIADAGLIHMHKVGSTRQAVKAEELGVDVVIASGYEMGGHTHAVPMHTFVLLPNVTETVSVPVLLSGGARDGRTLAAALCLGAAGVAMGTRFIASTDNQDWHPATARRIVEAGEGDDIIFPGVYSPARGLRSAGVERLLGMLRDGATAEELLAYKDAALIRAEEEGDLDSGILPAGQVASGIRDIVSAAEFVPAMAAAAAALLNRLAPAAAAFTAT
jgi:NAD(P)H-dependent flavin oxidoreductase YrpB (nitropropane dioxygenase family)